MQEAYHDLCIWLESLDTSVLAKEQSVINGVQQLKESIADIDLSNIEQAIGEVKGAVANIDFSTLAKEDTLTTSVQSTIDAINSIEIPTTDLSGVESSIAEVKQAVESIEIPTTDLTPVAKESTLNTAKEEIIEAVNNSVQQYDSIIATQLKSIIGE